MAEQFNKKIHHLQLSVALLKNDLKKAHADNKHQAKKNKEARGGIANPQTGKSGSDPTKSSTDE